METEQPDPVEMVEIKDKKDGEPQKDSQDADPAPGQTEAADPMSEQTDVSPVTEHTDADPAPEPTDAEPETVIPVTDTGITEAGAPPPASTEGDDGAPPLEKKAPESPPKEAKQTKSPAERVRSILQTRRPDDEENEEDEFDPRYLRVHALFCQLDVLCHFENGIMGWKEMARWMKYEEKVEAGNRWSKPHVSTTSLHALFEVRRMISDGTAVVTLDLGASHGCLHQVAEKLTQLIGSEKGLSEEKTKQVFDALVRPHKHRSRKGKKHAHDKSDGSLLGFPESGAEIETSTPKKGSADDTGATEDPDHPHPHDHQRNKIWKPKLQKKGSAKETSALHHSYPGGIVPDDLDAHKPNKKLMRKIPGGSEAANILIGNVDFLDEPIMAFVRLANAHVLADMTEVALPTRFMFILLGPKLPNAIWEYEEVGRSVATLLSDRVFCELAYKAQTRQDLVDGMNEFIDDLTVLPPSVWDPTTRLEPPKHTMSIDMIKRRLMDSSRFTPGQDAYHFGTDAAQDDSTLNRTGKVCGGLLADMKRRYRYYISDIKDGFNLQCLASIIFLYFACITPIVTFGGILGHATNGEMGTMETLLAGAFCGTIYAAFSGQPLTIIGATGPMLIFESIVYHVCFSSNVDFLSFRFWIGLWVTGILIVFVIFDLSCLVRYITRFTEESFAVLISLIFIVEAFRKVSKIWDSHPFAIDAAAHGDDYKCHCQAAGSVNSSVTGNPVTQTVLGLLGGGSADANDTGYNVTDSTGAPITTGAPPYDLQDWIAEEPENCITHLGRVIVESSCITKEQCTDHGWEVVGLACDDWSVIGAVPDVYFVCWFLFIGTFGLAYIFRRFKGGLFFPSLVRTVVSDFAVLLAVFFFSIVDYGMGLDTPKLNVPSQFKTTIEGRGWVVNPGAVTHWWLPIIAVLPALLAVILIFLDQQITAVIVNRKEHKLKKGHGYHLDLFILAILIFLCSLLGLPWFVAATVRSVTHVRSLIKESELRAPGERPQMLGVREQRVTGFVIHVLIGISTLITVVLQYIPMAVLYGVFLYMGVTSLSGVQFVQRILLLFMPAKYQPDYVFLRHVETKRIHIFTVIQICCMILMWLIKSFDSIAIAFPLTILLVCFVRKAMDYVFTQGELYWLDHILPEFTLKKKDDKGDVTEEDVKPLHAKDVEAAQHPHLDGKLPLVDSWSQLIAKRDYGLGRTHKPRARSHDVIRRHRDQYRPVPADLGDTIEEEDDWEEPSHPSRHHLLPVSLSFRERKFSY